LPSLKCNNLKRFIYRISGYNIEKGVVIASSAKIMGAIKVSIGEYTFIGHETMMMGGGDGNIKVGKCCDISSRVNIVSGTHFMDMRNIRSAGKGLGKEIVIEDGVWIGFGAIILPGVTIGFKSVIGAGAVVNKNIPPYSVVVGSPMRIIKTWSPESKEWILS
jgi:maltose O-acetyltransferase